MQSFWQALFGCSVILGSQAGAGINERIVETIAQMPKGGNYAKLRTDLPAAKQRNDLHRTVAQLSKAVAPGKNGMLHVMPNQAAGPSFCSSATYLLFAEVVAALQEEGLVAKDAALTQALATVGDPKDVIAGKLDGVGIFGHWNADGPGTAVLFHRLDLGKNFLGFVGAQPGDFLKIFWNEAIGKGESGHSVVYLGESADGKSIQVWSSNQHNGDGTSGYGTMWVEKSRIARALFSRLERPENLKKWLEFDAAGQRSDYLIRIRETGSTEEELWRETGIEPLNRG